MRILFYLVDLLRTQAWQAASQIALRVCSEEEREETGWIGVLPQNSVIHSIKMLPLIKENQISPDNEFSPFLFMGRCKSLGSWKSFLWCEPQLIRASILFFPVLYPFRALLWVGGKVWWLDGLSILCLLIGQAIFFILISYSRAFKDWNPLYFREELIIPTVFPFSKWFCPILKLGSVWHFSVDYHHHNFMVPSIEALISNMYFFKKSLLNLLQYCFCFMFLLFGH